MLIVPWQVNNMQSPAQLMKAALRRKREAAKQAEQEAQKIRYQSAEYQAKAREALERINSGKPGAFDKIICKHAGLL